MVTLNNSLLQTSPSPLVGGVAPKAGRHPCLRPGTQMLYDFTDARCQPGGIITPGSAAGMVFPALNGGVTATITGGSWTVNADGSLSPPGSGNDILTVGTPGQFDLSGVNPTPETLTIMWLKVTAIPALYTYLFGFTGTDINHAPVSIYTSSTSALKIAGNIGGQAGGASTSFGAGADNIALNQVHQVAVNYVPGVRVDLYIDAVLAASSDNPPVPTSFNPSPSTQIQVSGQWAGKVYAMSYHNLTASVAAEVAEGRRLSDIMTARRHIERDHTFHTGAFVGAPCNAFAA